MSVVDKRIAQANMKQEIMMKLAKIQRRHDEKSLVELLEARQKQLMNWLSKA